MSTADYSPSSTRMHSVSSTAQLRKIKKPLIERRRRERINECLNQLKVLVLEAMHKDESRYSKMEKADILEMTVAHLKSIQNRRSSSIALRDPESVGKYVVGFKECALEVVTYLKNCNQLGNDVHVPLIRHLGECLQKAPQLTSPVTSETSTTSVVSLPVGMRPSSLSPTSNYMPTGRCFASPVTTSQPCAFSPVSDDSMLSPSSTSRLSPPMMSTFSMSISPPVMLNNVIPLYAISSNTSSRSISTTSTIPRSFTNSPTQADEAPHMFRQSNSSSSNTFLTGVPTLPNVQPVFIEDRNDVLNFQVKSEVWRPW